MNTAIITSAGIGKRMNEKTSKILLSLADKPILFWAIKSFEDCNLVDSIIIVINNESKEETEQIVKKYKFKKIKKIVLGGKERQDSVYNGIKSIENPKSSDAIVIHNGANPFVTDADINNCIDAAEEFGAAAVGIRSRDTVKQVDCDDKSLSTLDRKKIFLMQTPQAIRYDLAIEAFEKAKKDNFYGTDDVQLVERLDKIVKIVESSQDNKKITYPFDLAQGNLLRNSIKVGIGQDSHRFAKSKKPLVLGGAIIENHNGLEANSDGDVILHSLFNAISSSIGEHSIGYYADEMCKKGIKNSKEYLKVILKKLDDEGYILNNIGIAIECKTPKILPIEDKIKKSLSEILGIAEHSIGITATSGEELTEFGKGLGIQCFSVVGIRKK